MTGVEMKEEEEPKGKVLVGPEGEALRPPGISMVSSPTHFLTFFCKYLSSSPLKVFFCIKELFWSLGKLVEDEGEGEKPDMCSKEQMEFKWAHTWLGDGGMPALARRQGTGATLSGILVFLDFFPSFCPGFWLYFEVNWSFHFLFRVYICCNRPMF